MVFGVFFYRYTRSYKEILSRNLKIKNLEIILVSKPNKSGLSDADRYCRAKSRKTIAVKSMGNYSITRSVIFKDTNNQTYKASAKIFFDGFDVSYIKWILSLPLVL